MTPTSGPATARAAPGGRTRNATQQPAAPRATPGRHLRVAPERARVQRRARLAMWGIVVGSILAMFLLLAFHVVAVQHAFEMNRLASQRAQEERRYERLREQVATLSAPDAIVAAATHLGMVPAQHVQFIQAPPAAPRGEKNDPTADTLGRS